MEKDKNNKLLKEKIKSSKENKNLPTLNEKILFVEKEEEKATEALPDQINIDDNINEINKDSKKKSKKKEENIPDSLKIEAEFELKEILKNDPNNLKKLIEFKKKYKFYNIKPYIRKAKEFHKNNKNNENNENNNENNKKKIKKQNTIHSQIIEEMNKNKRLKNIIEKVRNAFQEKKINVKKLFKKLDKNGNGKLEGEEFQMLFLVLDIEGINSDDVLLLNSYLDLNKNGTIEYREFINLIK